MGLLFNKKWNNWVGELQDLSPTNDSRIDVHDQQFLLGAQSAFTVAHAARQSANNPWLDVDLEEVKSPVDFGAGFKAAGYLSRDAIEGKTVPSNDYLEELSGALQRGLQLEICQPNRADAQLVDSLNATTTQVVRDLIETLNTSDDEAKRELSSEFLQRLESGEFETEKLLRTVDPSLNEKSYARAMMAEVQLRLSESRPSVETELLRGMELAIEVRDHTKSPLRVLRTLSKSEHSGPWKQYSEAFMAGYRWQIRRWGNIHFFERVAFQAEELDSDIHILKRQLGLSGTSQDSSDT